MPPCRSRRSLLFLLFLFCVCGGLRAAEPGHTVRLLTVGNSFSHNATHYLGDLAKAAGDQLVLREEIVGGASLALHWGKAEAFEKDANDPAGRYSTGHSLKEELTREPWDFVTIQQASILSHDVSTYEPFARQLRDYIGAQAPHATLLLHETWEYRVDDPMFSETRKTTAGPKTQEEMYRGLSEAYRQTAGELKLRLIPVGDAFHAANHDPQWGFRAPAAFDSKQAKPGELPNQEHSLNVGWSWKAEADGSKKLIMDGHHANMAGEYLGACVWFEVLFGESVVDNTFVPKGLDPEYARFLRATAHRVVEENR